MGEVFTTALPMFPAQLRLVSVGCGECRRGGWYRLDRLVARYGSDGPIPRLISALGAECPKRCGAAAYQCKLTLQSDGRSSDG